MVLVPLLAFRPYHVLWHRHLSPHWNPAGTVSRLFLTAQLWTFTVFNLSGFRLHLSRVLSPLLPLPNPIFQPCSPRDLLQSFMPMHIPTVPLSSHTCPSDMPFLKSSLTAPRPYRLDAAFSAIPQDPVDLANNSSCLTTTTGRKKKKKKSHCLFCLSWTICRGPRNLSSFNPGPHLHLQAYQVLYSLQTHHALVILAFYFSNIIASFQPQGLFTFCSLCLERSSVRTAL